MGNTRLKLWRLSLPVLICLLVSSGVFIFPLAQPAAAATDGYSISGGAGPNHRPSTAISPDSGTVCTVWTTFNNSPNQTYVRLYSTATGSWRPDLSQAAFNVSRNDGGSAQGNTARCAIDGAGRTHVVWVEYPDGRVRYSMLAPGADPANGANWTYPIDITTSAGEGDGQNPDIVSIFADANGNVWLAYWSLSNSGVFVRQWINGSGWSGATKVSSSGGKHPRIGADNAGYVHVVYQQSGAGMRYSYRDAATGQWNIDNAVPGAGGLIEQSGIAVDRDNGDVHIVLTVALGSEDNSRVVRYIKKTGRTGLNFTGQRDLTGQGNHVVARIAWSPSGKLTMVSDKRDSRTVTIATSNDNGNNWSGASDLTSANASQAWPAVSMDAAGNSYVVYWTGENINFVQIGNTPNPGGGGNPPPTVPAPTTVAVGQPVQNTLTSVTVNWTTDVASSSRVFFSPQNVPVDTNCTTETCTAGDPEQVTSHAVTIRNLAPGTTYNYQIRSSSTGGTTLDPTVRQFTTPNIEVVGTGQTADGKFAALVYIPAGFRAEWRAGAQGYQPVRGTTTQKAEVVAFSGDISPNGPGQYPLIIRYNGNDGLVATSRAINYNPAFRAAFNDVDPNSTSPFAVAIYELRGRGIVQGSDGNFRPLDPIARAEAAAIVARAMTWISESGANSFSDLGNLDAELQNDVQILADYGVAQGYGDGTFDPAGSINQAQIISLVTRAMVAKGYWTYQNDDGRFPNVPPSSGHRQDIVTFDIYTGGTLSSYFADTNAGVAAERRFVARVMWEAVKWRETQVNGAAIYEVP
jgi:hypothetical protein